MRDWDPKLPCQSLGAEDLERRFGILGQDLITFAVCYCTFRATYRVMA